MKELLEQIKHSPNNIDFYRVIVTITTYYHYRPTRFTNGVDENNIISLNGTNEGSCKIFAFAHLHQLSQNETLACFGTFYRDDVLKHPQNKDHQNIRQFMISGSMGIHFDHFPLTIKTEG